MSMRSLNAAKHFLLSLMLLFLIFLLFIAGCSTQTPVATTQQPTVSDQAVSQNQEQPITVLVTVAIAPKATLSAVQKSLANDYNLTSANDWPLISLDIYCFIYKLPVQADPEQLIATIEQDPRVDSAQLIRQFNILSRPKMASGIASRPDYDDEHYPLQYGLRTLKADQAHQWSTGKSVKVGIVDTGIDVNHKDLTSVKYTRSFVGKPSAIIYPENHGTAIAGIIAASANNEIGIVGIAPDAELIGLRGCWQPEASNRGICNSLSLARAIDYANVNDINILNLSLQGPHDPIIDRLLQRAIERNGVIITAYQPSQNDFPASQQGVIAVTSNPLLLSKHQLRSTMVAAPGQDILTTVPASQYDLLQGSSLAAAHVTGVVALLREQQPDLPPKRIAKLLTQAMHEPADDSAINMINACMAIITLLEHGPTEKTLKKQLC